VKDKLTIVKVGGKIVEDENSLDVLLKEFAAIDGFKLLVHGGGRSATAMASQLGIETVMIDGRRVTDSEMLKVVTMVYGGSVNKNIVARLQAMGIDALGMTGADMNIILSRKRPATPVDYGWVGDPIEVNDSALSSLIMAGVVPVVAPLTHDGLGHLLNTNADTMAGTVARGLAERFDVSLVYCFEKPGVLADEHDDASVIATINRPTFETLRTEGVVSGGMIPKIENALSAVDAGVAEVVITAHNALSAGTRIVR
jgi:acetylglutamate kinase